MKRYRTTVIGNFRLLCQIREQPIQVGGIDSKQIGVTRRRYELGKKRGGLMHVEVGGIAAVADS
jgi:hypothetical protein